MKTWLTPYGQNFRKEGSTTSSSQFYVRDIQKGKSAVMNMVSIVCVEVGTINCLNYVMRGGLSRDSSANPEFYGGGGFLQESSQFS